jgi:folate-binding protein YgfZ
MSQPLPPKSEYLNLTEGAGFVELGPRCFVRLTGNDRQAFFHNFCTNEIKQLNPGDVCEAFVLNTKGKLLGHVYALAFENELLLSGHGPQGPTIVPHLDKYLIREDVELLDESESHAAIFVCGDQAPSKLAELELPGQNQCIAATLGQSSVQISHVEVAGMGYLITFPSRDLESVRQFLSNAGLECCTLATLEILRVEQRTPWFGIDADETNLPQELQRDEQAINFNKGCYLGQETVARIDARGRVNQLLVGLELGDGSISPGDKLTVEEKTVGKITSTVYSFARDKTIGLGYVRRAFHEPGTEIGSATVM